MNETSPPGPARAAKRFEIPALVWIYAAMIALLILAYWTIPGLKPLVDDAYALLTSNDREAIQAWVDGFGWWGPVLILVLMIGQTILSAVPMILVMIVSVLAYGPVLGGLLGWSGAILAALLGYSLARALGPVVVDRFVSAPVRKTVEQAVSRYGAWAIIALRLSPLVPSDGVSFVAGLINMKPLPFLMATIAGVTPVTLAVAFFGSNLDQLRWLIVLVTVVSLFGLIAYIAIDLRRRKRAAGQP
jgi:uncharacterized membrane protein YdjX (TVP38/TMEM64 family)